MKARADRSEYAAHRSLVEAKGTRAAAPRTEAVTTRPVTLGQVLRWTFGGAALVVVLGPLLT